MTGPARPLEVAQALHSTTAVVKPGARVAVSIGVVPVQVWVTVYVASARPVGQTDWYTVS